MAKATDVKRHPGVFSRSSSTAWQFKRAAPDDLAHAYPDGWARRHSLGTSDLREANAKAALLWAELDAEFASHRQTPPSAKVEHLSADVVARIAAEVRRFVLQADDNIRDFPEAATGLIAAEAGMSGDQGDTVDSAITDAVQADAARPGRTLAQAGAITRFNERHLRNVAQAWASRDLNAVRGIADAAARSLGLAVSWDAPDSREALRECLRAYRVAVGDVARRDQGEVVETPKPSRAVEVAPVMSGAATVSGGPGLLPIALIRQTQGLDLEAGKKSVRELFADYFEAHRSEWKSWEDRVRRDYGPVRDAFVGLVGNVPIETLNVSHARRFAQHVHQQTEKAGGKQATTAKKLSRLQAVLNWARQHAILPDLTGPLKMAAENVSYEAFTPAELRTIFESAAYKSNGFTRASQFWLPLLALYTGARLNELASARVEHVHEVDGVPGILLSPEGKKTGKNAASLRFVPLHPAVLSAGFLGYVDAIGDEGHADLFPDLPNAERDGKGKAASRDFTEYRRSLGIGSAEGEGRGTKAAHSFRATLTTAMQRAGVPGEVRISITGHAPEGVHERVYSQGEVPLSIRLDALTKAVFDFTHPEWKDTGPYRAARRRRRGTTDHKTPGASR